MNKIIMDYRKFFGIMLYSFISLLLLLSSCAQKPEVNEQNLTEGWQIISAADIDADGKALTSGAIQSEQWVNTTVPTTVLGALVESGVYKEPFFADNLAKIPTEPFENPWWYRKEFYIDNFNSNAEELRLLIDGINYRRTSG
jgi:exo-1,4-beta-D-glucosaminidase